MNNEGSVVISKMFKFEKDRSINLNISHHVQFLRENMTIEGKYDDRRLQSKERINV